MRISLSEMHSRLPAGCNTLHSMRELGLVGRPCRSTAEFEAPELHSIHVPLPVQSAGPLVNASACSSCSHLLNVCNTCSQLGLALCSRRAAFGSTALVPSPRGLPRSDSNSPFLSHSDVNCPYMLHFGKCLYKCHCIVHRGQFHSRFRAIRSECNLVWSRFVRLCLIKFRCPTVVPRLAHRSIGCAVSDLLLYDVQLLHCSHSSAELVVVFVACYGMLYCAHSHLHLRIFDSTSI